MSPLRLLRRSSPKLARPDNRNFLDGPHVEKIAVDADQQCTFSGNCSPQYWYVLRITTQVRRKVGGHNNYADATQEGNDLIDIASREVELLDEFSMQLVENEFGNHQLVVQQ